jgi:hypothetical protein
MMTAIEFLKQGCVVTGAVLLVLAGVELAVAALFFLVGWLIWRVFASVTGGAPR